MRNWLNIWLVYQADSRWCRNTVYHMFLFLAPDKVGSYIITFFQQFDLNFVGMVLVHDLEKQALLFIFNDLRINCMISLIYIHIAI